MTEALRLTCPVDGRYRLTGSLTLQQFEPLWQRRAELLKQDCELDLSGLDTLDTAGLAVLVELLAEAKSRQVRLAYHGLTERVQRLIRVNQLDPLFQLN